MLLTISSFAVAQESEIVMTQEELDSFLSKIAEARRSKLEAGKTFKVSKSTSRDLKNEVEAVEEMDESNVMRQLDRINDRIDDLFMLHAMGDRIDTRKSAVVVPKNRNNVIAVPQDDKATIAELQRQLDALKAEKAGKTELVQDISQEEQRIANAKTPEERRDALKDLLAKFKNFKKQVFFANDSDKVTSADMAYISDVVTILNKYPELSIVLEGWASPVGNANYNKQLSMRRSESVEKVLLEKGVSADRIVSSFRGEDKSTSVAKARRVDMSVILK